MSTASLKDFAADELAIVLSRYDLGPIEAIHEHKRGSPASNKLVVRADGRTYLLKRRPPGRDDFARVTLAHEVHQRLSSAGFPLPRLIEAEHGEGAFVTHAGHIYELFEFVVGNRYDASLPATTDAGRAMAEFHRLLHGFTPAAPLPPPNCYHASPRLADQLAQIGAGELGGREGVRECCEALRAMYYEAAGRATACGADDWPAQLIHGDWHPGNMIFRGAALVAVLDLDGVRSRGRGVDVASGAMHFCIAMGGDDPGQWPDYADESRFKRFCRGYESGTGGAGAWTLSTSEIAAFPWLMAEALIAEAVAPVAATGSFLGFDGGAFLAMITRKARWIGRNAPRLVDMAAA